jgi:hypothetical protein
MSQVSMPEEPALIISDGDTVRVLVDSAYRTWIPDSTMSQLDRDLIVTRLRAWLDKIESSDLS